MDVATLAALLQETAEHPGSFEAAAPPHNWWDWYAAYLDARQERQHPGTGHRGRPTPAVAADPESSGVARDDGRGLLPGGLEACNSMVD